MIGQVDHVAIAVWNIDASLAYYVNELGLPLVADEQLPLVGVRLAYLDAGNVFVQLVQPTSSETIRRFLEERGEGLHHLCFAVENIPEILHRLVGEEQAQLFLGGRGRRCAFLLGQHNGLITELTEIAPFLSERPVDSIEEETAS
jgi:methylmalonyl-CoA/ethylmalonyl-CoA epimerase